MSEKRQKLEEYCRLIFETLKDGSGMDLRTGRLQTDDEDVNNAFYGVAIIDAPLSSKDGYLDYKIKSAIFYGSRRTGYDKRFYDVNNFLRFLITDDKAARLLVFVNWLENILEIQNRLVYAKKYNAFIDNTSDTYKQFALEESVFGSFFEKCCVCGDETERKNVCKHTLCMLCWTKLKSKKCPLCREKIKYAPSASEDSSDSESE